MYTEMEAEGSTFFGDLKEMMIRCGSGGENSDPDSAQRGLVSLCSILAKD